MLLNVIKITKQPRNQKKAQQKTNARAAAERNFGCMACLCLPPQMARDFWYYKISIGGERGALGYLRAVHPSPLPLSLLALGKDRVLLLGIF